MNKNNILLNQILPGFLLAFVFALPAWFLGGLFPIVGSPILAILFGILGSVVIPEKFKRRKGLSFIGSQVFQFGIILLGFSINIKDIIYYGNISFKISIITVTATFLSAYFLQKKFRLPANSILLLSIGTAISGPNAIGATSPVIKAKNEETVHALTIILFFNVLAAMFLPHLALYLNMSNIGFVVFAGVAINDTSSVTAAATYWDGLTGGNIVGAATITKLVRTLMIIPVIIFLFFRRMKREKNCSTTSDINHKYEFIRTFPYFILFFVLASLIPTFMAFSPELAADFKLSSKLLIILAMAAIGLNSNILKLIERGIKSVILPFILWGNNIILCLLLQLAFNIW